MTHDIMIRRTLSVINWEKIVADNYKTNEKLGHRNLSPIKSKAKITKLNSVPVLNTKQQQTKATNNQQQNQRASRNRSTGNFKPVKSQSEHQKNGQAKQKVKPQQQPLSLEATILRVIPIVDPLRHQRHQFPCPKTFSSTPEKNISTNRKKGKKKDSLKRKNTSNHHKSSKTLKNHNEEYAEFVVAPGISRSVSRASSKQRKSKKKQKLSKCTKYSGFGFFTPKPSYYNW